MRSFTITAALTLLAGSLAAQADTVQVTWGYNLEASALQILGPDGATPLPCADNNGTTGTGYAAELGYYTQATAANPFAGTWMPVFGKGDANSLFANASLGDGRTTTTSTDARFSLTGTVDSTVPSTLTNLPAAGQIMAIRFYNAAQSASASYFGAASNPTWKWTGPGSIPPIPLSFNASQSGTIFQGGTALPTTNQRTFTQSPQITMQPSNASGPTGSTATFTVAASGPDLSYQWYYNDTAIAGANGSSYTATVDGTTVGSYYVTVTDAYGDTVTSGTFALSASAAMAAADTPAMPLVGKLLLGLALIMVASFGMRPKGTALIS